MAPGPEIDPDGQTRHLLVVWVVQAPVEWGVFDCARTARQTGSEICREQAAADRWEVRRMFPPQARGWTRQIRDNNELASVSPAGAGMHRSRSSKASI